MPQPFNLHLSNPTPSQPLAILFNIEYLYCIAVRNTVHFIRAAISICHLQIEQGLKIMGYGLTRLNLYRLNKYIFIRECNFL